MIKLEDRACRERAGSRSDGGNGRRVNLTDYLSSPPDEMVVEDDERDGEDGYDGMVSDAYMEGARVSELYDAYGAHGWSSRPLGSSLSRRSHPNISTVFASPPDVEDSSSQETSAPPRSEFRPPTWGPPGTTSFVGGSVASRPSRQAIVRRPIRARGVDFNEFSARRRSSFRDGGDTEDPRPSEEAPDLGSWFSPSLEETEGSSGSQSYARRFFPTVRRRRESSVWHDVATGERGYPSEEVHTILRPWHASSSSSSITVGDHEDRLPTPTPDTVPRLRRGGVRAPESLRSPRSSPGVRDTPVPSTSSILISISREAHRDVIPEISAPPPIAASSEGQN